MNPLQPRIADEIDDYCPRCRLLTNHTIASLVSAKDGASPASIAQTSCRTCRETHDYRHARVPKPKLTSKAQAFDQVLAGILGPQVPPSEPKPVRKSGTRKAATLKAES